MTNPLYALVLLSAAVTSIEILQISRKHYREYGVKKRLVYPLLMVVVRMFRTYFFLIGLLRHLGRLRGQDDVGGRDQNASAKAIQGNNGLEHVEPYVSTGKNGFRG